MIIRDVFPGLRVYTRREIGIEIEMETNRPEVVALAPGGWKVTADGSLRGNSAEFVFRQPQVRADVMPLLRNLKNALDQADISIINSDRAGVHVHINCQALEEIEVINFIGLYLIFEEALMRYCGPSREGNLFCLRATDAGEIIWALLDAVKKGTLIGLADGNRYRYASVNPASLAKYGSLEFRGLATPVDVMSIEPWVNMLLMIKDKSLTFKTLREIIEAMSSMGGHRFTNFIFEDHAKFIINPDIHEQVMRGIWNVQDVAYVGEYRASGKIAPNKAREGMVRVDIPPLVWDNAGNPAPNPRWFVDRPDDNEGEE